MKAGGLYIAVGLLAVLGGLVWYTNKHPKADAKKEPAQTVIRMDPIQIEEIKILKPGADPVVLKKISDEWRITEPKPYPADSEVVSPITGALAMITADRLIDDNPANLKPYGLDNPALELDATMKGGKVNKVLLGSDTPSNSGTYIKAGDSPKVYIVAATVKTDLAKTLNDVRDKRFMTFTSDKLTAISLKAKGDVDFARNADNDWTIVKPRQLRADNLLIDDMTRRLKDARMEMPPDYDAAAANKLFAEGTHVATVTTTEGKDVQTFEVRKVKAPVKDKNAPVPDGPTPPDVLYYAKSNLDPNAYKIVNDIGDGLNKGAEDFRAKKVFAFGFQDTTKLQINDKTYVKSGNKAESKWTANGVQFDSITIEDVFDKLRDLVATELSDKKGGTQVVTLGVTYGDKGHSEKVTIFKDDKVYRAMREDDPSTVYVLGSQAVEDLQKTIGAIKQYQPPPPAKKK